MDMDFAAKECLERLVISRHGYTRMKERNGWGKKAAARMIRKIYEQGRRPSQVKGYLKGWIRKKMEGARAGREFILFGENLYIFNRNTMLTVLPTPARSCLMKGSLKEAL